jgi:hypothetical protein
MFRQKLGLKKKVKKNTKKFGEIKTIRTFAARKQKSFLK